MHIDAISSMKTILHLQFHQFMLWILTSHDSRFHLAKRDCLQTEQKLELTFSELSFKCRILQLKIKLSK